jgi:hypothetical protein
MHETDAYQEALEHRGRGICPGVGVGLLQPAAAQAVAQAPVYWTFMNGTFDRGHCLTGGQKNADGTGKACMSWCNGGFQQQWDWRGSDSTHPHYLLLQNRATGLCLATDAKSNANVAWTSTCELRADMCFRFDCNASGSSESLTVSLMSGGDYIPLRPARNRALCTGGY